jgi:hypothetical protein
MRNILRKVLLFVVAMLMIALAGLFVGGYGQAQKTRAVSSATTPAVQQPLFTEYKGIKLGMSAQEVRAKLGNPVLKDDAMDYFIFADDVTAQFVYDKTHAVRTISIDYAGGTGAPEYQSVVGPGLETRPDGSAYKIVRYESFGFWVSYNRTAGPVVTVTITIQKL